MVEIEMENIGIFIEFKDGQPKPANFGMIAAARGEGRKLFAFLLNGGGETVREKLGEYGVERIIEISLSNGDDSWHPSRWAEALVEAMQHFDIKTLLGLTTPQGRDLLPRVAAILDAPLIMDCIDVDLANRTVKTSQYSGKTIATIQLTGDYAIYGLRPNAIPATKAAAQAEIEAFQCDKLPDDGVELLESRSGAGDAADLAEADIIISGGRGLRGGENFKLLFDCAREMGAAVGASRVAVDEGWVPYTMQVGQTGVKVNPSVYIACGISGSVQHFAGMKTSERIIAINEDENAAIMSKCDYYAVGNVFEIVPALTARLREIKNRS